MDCFSAPLPAGWLRREAARLIDFLLASAVVFPVAIYMGNYPGIGLAIMCYVAYPVLGEGVFGATVGKRLAGIEVTKPDGGIPNIGRAMCRWIAFVPIRFALFWYFAVVRDPTDVEFEAVWWFFDLGPLLLLVFWCFSFAFYAWITVVFLAPSITALLFVDAFEFVVSRWNRDRRTLHELLSDTRVVARAEQVAATGQGW